MSYLGKLLETTGTKPSPNPCGFMMRAEACGQRPEFYFCNSFTRLYHSIFHKQDSSSGLFHEIENAGLTTYSPQ